MQDYGKAILELSEKLKHLSDAAARASGEISSLMKILKSEFEVDSLEEAVELLEAMKSDRDTLLEELEESISEVREVLDGYDNES